MPRDVSVKMPTHIVGLKLHRTDSGLGKIKRERKSGKPSMKNRYRELREMPADQFTHIPTAQHTRSG